MPLVVSAMAESPQVFRVLPRQVDQTDAAALRQWLPGKSWSEVRALLETRRVLVNGNSGVDAGRLMRGHGISVSCDGEWCRGHMSRPPLTLHTCPVM
jgi:hypothetical protein